MMILCVKVELKVLLMSRRSWRWSLMCHRKQVFYFLALRLKHIISISNFTASEIRPNCVPLTPTMPLIHCVSDYCDLFCLASIDAGKTAWCLKKCDFLTFTASSHFYSKRKLSWVRRQYYSTSWHRRKDSRKGCTIYVFQDSEPKSDRAYTSIWDRSSKCVRFVGCI